MTRSRACVRVLACVRAVRTETRKHVDMHARVCACVLHLPVSAWRHISNAHTPALSLGRHAHSHAPTHPRTHAPTRILAPSLSPSPSFAPHDAWQQHSPPSAPPATASAAAQPRGAGRTRRAAPYPLQKTLPQRGPGEETAWSRAQPHADTDSHG